MGVGVGEDGRNGKMKPRGGGGWGFRPGQGAGSVAAVVAKS